MEKMGRSPRPIQEDDYEARAEVKGLSDDQLLSRSHWEDWALRMMGLTEQQKQAAADVLFHYSQFVMVCIGEGVRPTDLRLHLMKEISGMPTSLKKEPSPLPAPASPDSTGEPSSSSAMKVDKFESS